MSSEKKPLRPPSPPKTPPRHSSLPGKNSQKAKIPGESSEESPAEIAFPGGVETLLETTARKPLPQIPQQKGRRCLLYDIIQFSPKLYSKMIGYLRNGVSPEVAAEICSIGERTFYEWAQRGRLDLDYVDPQTGSPDPQDTYFSRFYLDVRRAIAAQAGDCEIKLAAIDPRKWLTVGPGRIFGAKWAKDKNNPTASNGHHQNANGSVRSLPSPDDPIDATFTITHSPSPYTSSPGETHDGDSSDTDSTDPTGNRSLGNASRLAVSPQEEYQTLQVLEEIGMLNLSDSMRKAYQEQLGLASAEPQPHQVAN